MLLVLLYRYSGLIQIAFLSLQMLLLLLCLTAGILILLLTRLVIQLNAPVDSPRGRTKPARTLIVLGSGGHTAEMLALTAGLNHKLYTPRIYVMANTDKISQTKVLAQESISVDFQILEVPRSREVRQSYASSVFSTLRATWSCVPIVWQLRPDVVLTNGPGTCVPIVAIVWLLRLIGVNPCVKLVFVESYCRVQSVSLSGKILQWLVDLFVVQWPGLAAKTNRSSYLGKLM